MAPAQGFRRPKMKLRVKPTSEIVEYDLHKAEKMLQYQKDQKLDFWEVVEENEEKPKAEAKPKKKTSKKKETVKDDDNGKQPGSE